MTSTDTIRVDDLKTALEWLKWVSYSVVFGTGVVRMRLSLDRGRLTPFRPLTPASWLRCLQICCGCFCVLWPSVRFSFIVDVATMADV